MTTAEWVLENAAAMADGRSTPWLPATFGYPTSINVAASMIAVLAQAVIQLQADTSPDWTPVTKEKR